MWLFLLGSFCGNENCSATYCGAGTDGNKGPGLVSLDNNTDYINNDEINKTISNMSNVFNFPGLNTDGTNSSRKWSENINTKDFTCYDDSNINNSCFNGCNYVNFNDTCWMANPEERQIVMNTNGINWNTWKCDNKNIGDSCETYNGKYGCFGTCSINDYSPDNIKGNCGTDEWFNYKMDLNPNETKYKLRKNF